MDKQYRNPRERREDNILRAAQVGRLEMIPVKSKGQIAYEADVLKTPNYPDGAPRKAWSDLSNVEQWSWDRPPMALPGVPNPQPNKVTGHRAGCTCDLCY